MRPQQRPSGVSRETHVWAVFLIEGNTLRDDWRMETENC